MSQRKFYRAMRVTDNDKDKTVLLIESRTTDAGATITPPSAAIRGVSLNSKSCSPDAIVELSILKMLLVVSEGPFLDVGVSASRGLLREELVCVVPTSENKINEPSGRFSSGAYT